MSAEPMTVFTGGKLHIYVPKEHDKLFAKVKVISLILSSFLALTDSVGFLVLQYYMDNKWIAKCGTHHTDAKYGLVQGHEYTLLSVLEMKSKGGHCPCPLPSSRCIVPVWRQASSFSCSSCATRGVASSGEWMSPKAMDAHDLCVARAAQEGQVGR
jgi:hypothetical protein